MTGELTLLVIRLIFLAVMWIFVFSIIYALRSDLFGSRTKQFQKAIERSRQQTFAAATNGDAGAPAPAPVPAGAPMGAADAGVRRNPNPTVPPRPAPTPPADAHRPGGSGGTGGSVQAPMRRLVITSGPKRGHELELRGEPISIGRARDSDLVIQDDYTSTHHARLLNWNGQWMLQDLDSTNGSYVNGERVSQPIALEPGMSVRIGTTTFELR